MARNDLGEQALLVLASVVASPKHGYAIILDVERFTGSRLGPGTLYGILTRLERQGMIKALEAGERGRRPYRVTPAGKRLFDEHLVSLQQYRRALVALARE